MGPDGARRAPSLARHYRRWLGALAAAMGLLIAVASMVFVLLPLSQRSADDLAGLMLLSAQTWNELPPQTRPDFEAELLREHRIAVRPGAATGHALQTLHGFYVGFLEAALERRGGVAVTLIQGDGPEGGGWLWTTLTVGGEPFAVGFSSERMSVHPLLALGSILGIGALIVTLGAGWLARRIAQPVARLEHAAAQLAAGADPALLPEIGPRELADLAAHFNRMALQVRELIEARTTLLAGISHDLRTPLARMRLAIEMLTLRPDPQLIARLERDIEAIDGLIGQMLSLARGLAPAARQVLDLPPWLQERARLHATDAAPIAVEAAAGLQALVAPELLARVVDNFLVNALRYAPLRIELAATAGGIPSAIRISVHDRGPGVPPDQLAAIWQPFHRVEGSRSPATGGYGLGLALVQQLARSQGWQVGAEPRDGGGLSVWVEVPAATGGPASTQPAA